MTTSSTYSWPFRTYPDQLLVVRTLLSIDLVRSLCKAPLQTLAFQNRHSPTSIALLTPMDGARVHSWASGYFPPFSQLNDTPDCDATTDYFANSVLLVDEGTYLTNWKLGDIGITSHWLDSLIRSNWTGLHGVDDYEEILMVWYYGVWQNETYLNDTRGIERDAYISILNRTQVAAYTCDNKKICNKLGVRGDPDVSGIGVSLSCIASSPYHHPARKGSMLTSFLDDDCVLHT